VNFADQSAQPSQDEGDHRVTIAFGSAMWQTLCAEAERQSATVEEIVSYATVYYLADSDSGRLARKLP
jgi:hypothetical protein